MLRACVFFFRQCFFRVGAYYCLIGLLLVLCVDIEQVKLARVNFLQDSADYPVLYSTRRAAFDQKEFRRAKKYYQAISYTISYYEKNNMVLKPTALSRAYAMIAMCDYYLDNTDEAIVYLKKAIELEPREFWLNYNLGLVYFQRGQYTVAIGYFAKSALVTQKDFQESMQLDYIHLWPRRLAEQYKILNSIVFRNVVDNSNKFIALAQQRINDSPGKANLALAQKMDAPIENFDFFYNVSLNFVPIGQEKFFISKHHSLKSVR